jgi:hypothetical protein
VSRSFAASSTDLLTFAAGSAPPDQGPITVALLARATNVGNFTGWAVQGRKTTTGLWSILVDSGKLFCENDFGSGGPAHSNDWCWFVMTKASGSVIPRWHKLDITTPAAWVHVNDSGNVADGTGPVDNILVGGDASTSHVWRGEIGMIATWASVLSDAQVEAACTLAAADAFNAAPGWMVRFNQASVTTTVTDDTGNGGDQSARVGTSVGADDPPGFNYALTVPPSQGSAAFTLGLALGGTGSRPSAGSAALGLGLGIDVDGERPSAGSAALGLGLGIDVDGARPSAGAAALDLILGVDAEGARTAAGAAALTLGLALGATGSRSSSGSAALGLGLTLAATGEAPPVVPPAEGSAAFSLNLALAATGAAEISCLPFPRTCTVVPEFSGACADLPAFPGTCSPVPSFSEVTP